VEDGASISVISSGSQSLQARNAIFMWFQLFIEVLLRMHHKSNDRKELIDICKNSYKGNYQEMKIINEFEKDYKSENAIWWYTRESCFYRMLNKALRVQDFDMLFSFRFFITDIAKQIRSEYEKFIRTSDTRNAIHVYRGQVIGNDELELMKNSTGQYLSMNSFLSTSRARSTALHFARLTPITNGIQQIIFEIEINPRLQTKAFCDVTQLSFFQNEDEILIMLGALFRIEKVAEDKKDRVWVARISLASEDDYHLKETFSYMKKTIGDETDLNSLGKILLEMGEYDQTRKCYQRMLDEGNLVVGNAEFGLGNAYIDLKDSDKSLDHLNKALQIRQSILGPDHADVGQCYHGIGTALWYLLDDYDKALFNLKKAIEIEERALPPDSLEIARTYNNVAATYDCKENSDLALEYYHKALEIMQKILPPNHPKIAGIYNNLGRAHESMENHSKALKYYQKSLEISQKTLPPDHPELVRTKNNTDRLNNKMKK
jgi:tetratricopeptide (TPR) repeat protein